MHARVRRDAVDDRADRERSGRSRPVALAVVLGDAGEAEVDGPRAGGLAPAAAGALPEPHRAGGRRRVRRDDGDELRGGAGRVQRRDQVRLARGGPRPGRAERDREGGDGGEKTGCAQRRVRSNDMGRGRLVVTFALLSAVLAAGDAAAAPPFASSVHPVSCRRARLLLPGGLPRRAGRAPCGQALLLGVRPAAPSRHDRRQRSRCSGGARDLRAGSTQSGSRSAGWSRSPRSGEATTARWRPTTPRRSTAATRSRPGRSAGRSMHTARRSTSIRSRTRTCSTARSIRLPAGRTSTGRTARPGMAEPDGELVAAFAASGWQWGGRWTASPDYQHFSANGG